jgi:hypothetical protein
MTKRIRAPAGGVFWALPVLDRLAGHIYPE